MRGLVMVGFVLVLAAAAVAPAQVPDAVEGGTFTATLWGETVVTKFELAAAGENAYLRIPPGEKTIGVSSDIADVLWDAVEAQKRNDKPAKAEGVAVTFIPFRLHGYRTTAGPAGWDQYYDPARKGRSISKGLRFDVIARRLAVKFDKGELEIAHADPSKGCHVFTFAEGAEIVPSQTPDTLTSRGITYKLRPTKCAEFGSAKP